MIRSGTFRPRFKVYLTLSLASCKLVDDGLQSPVSSQSRQLRPSLELEFLHDRQRVIKGAGTLLKVRDRMVFECRSRRALL